MSDDKRIGKPVSFQGIISEAFLNAIVQRTTGRSGLDWEERYAERRMKGYRAGKFDPRRFFPLVGDGDEEADTPNPNAKYVGMLKGFQRYYGLDSAIDNEKPNMVCGWRKADEVMLAYPDFVLPFVKGKDGPEYAEHVLCTWLNPELWPY